MRVLWKYIFKSFFFPFMLGLSIFLVVVSVNLIYQISDTLLNLKVPMINILKMLWYYLPQFLLMGIPVGVLTAIFWTLSNMGSNMEIVALQVSGVKLKKIFYPYLIIALILCAFMFYLNDSIVPSFNYKADAFLQNVLYQHPTPSIKYNVFYKQSNNVYFYIERFNEKTNRFYNIVIYLKSSSNSLTITTAKDAYKAKDGNWYMYDVNVYNRDSKGYMRLNGHIEKVKLDVAKEIIEVTKTMRNEREMNTRQLKKMITNLKKAGHDPTNYMVEYNMKFVESLGPLIIVFVGVPIALSFNFKTKSRSIVATVIIVILYQGTIAWGRALAKNNYISPFMGTWGGSLIFLFAGVFLMAFLDSKWYFKIFYRDSKVKNNA